MEFSARIRLRTHAVLTSPCCICRNQENREMHHVKHLRKSKANGLTKLMVQLNRKQIPVCRTCHLKIHQGKYDGKK